MKNPSPMAFFSYVRSVDDHDDGRLSAFRSRLEGEVAIQTGEAFPIFQDRNDISWGQQWKERIRVSIDSSTFLIPIITQSFFNSPACREEFEAFETREATLGSRELILPIYYVSADAIEKFQDKHGDPIAKAIRERNWFDWRQFRFRDLKSEEVSVAVAQLAEQIKKRLDNLAAIRVAAASAQTITKRAPTTPPTSTTTIPSKQQNTNAFDPAIKEVWSDEQKANRPLNDKTYHVYTKQFDEVVHARDLITADMAPLRDNLTKRIDELSARHIAQVATLLQNISVLSSKSKTLITLLIDNSGSLRGRSAAYVAAWTAWLAEVLEHAGAMTEVLGFTTCAWKGGQSRKLWLANGKPAHPGRLNDLRHIVYKAANESARSAAADYTLMMREGVLKENVDGEALLWALERQNSIDASKKFLVVLSDGAPVDDATLSVNPGQILDKHLTDVSKWISSLPLPTLIGIGIGHDTSRYYSLSKVSTAEELGIAVLETINASI
jgi:cobaltochelatase CobT